jgi:hypothetical protein
MDPNYVTKLNDAMITGVIEGVYIALTRFWYLWVGILALLAIRVIFRHSSRKYMVAKLIILLIYLVGSIAVVFVPYIVRRLGAQ